MALFGLKRTYRRLCQSNKSKTFSGYGSVKTEEDNKGRELHQISHEIDPPFDTNREKSVEEEKSDREPKPVHVHHLYRYTTCCDRLLLAFGTLITLATGASLPLALLLYGEVITGFALHAMYQTLPTNDTSLDNRTASAYKGDDADKFSEAKVANIYLFIYDGYLLYLCLLGIFVIVAGSLQYIIWTYVGVRQTRHVRKLYYKAVIRQSVSWYDCSGTKEISTQFESDLGEFSKGVGHTASLVLENLATTVGSVIVAMLLSWKLCLACLSLLPVAAMIARFYLWSMSVSSRKTQESYTKAGTIAEEVFSAISTVQAFGAEERECSRYNESLSSASKVLIKNKIFLSLANGLYYVIAFGTAAISIGYGYTLYMNGEINPGDSFTMMIELMYAIIHAILTLQHLEAVVKATAAARRMFPVIDTMDETMEESEGFTPKTVNGKIEFKSVTFAYPSRKEVQVLKNVNLVIEPGQTGALVGSSGCGKTTVDQLLEKFYQADEGKILIDDLEINQINSAWLRRQIGYVNQEPVLFSTTIAENIRLGKMDASHDEIVRAAQIANAHTFITSLPEGYETNVGERGIQLSGGQKQRIAIARALVRDPKILLFDEATSSLDSENEARVQVAIESAKKGRTVLIIAHRLSTIREADVIFVMKEGSIVEKGTHLSLMEDKNGIYHSMVDMQNQIIYGRGISREDNTRNSVEKDGDATVEEEIDIQDVHIEEGEEETEKHPLRRIYRMSSPEFCYNFIGLILSAIFGTTVPVFVIYLTQYLLVFSIPSHQGDGFVTTVVLVMVIYSGTLCLCEVLSGFCFGTSWSRLTTRLRESVFRHIVYQDMSFFDERGHKVGLLTTSLATDTSSVQGASLENVGYITRTVVMFGSSVGVAFYYNWKLSLVALAFMPLFLVTGILQGGESLTNKGKKSRQNMQNESGQIVHESMSNIRHVLALGQIQIFEEKFNNISENIYRSSLRGIFPMGVVYGLSISIKFFMYAAVFSFGSHLVQYEGFNFAYVFRVFMCLNNAAAFIGRHSKYAADVAEAKSAALRLFAILDRKPRVAILDHAGNTLTALTGEIQMKRVHFRYPARRAMSVLTDLGITVRPNTKLAIVGESGSGKTTILQLLERFYTPDTGSITVDGTDIGSLDLRWFRSNIGIVSQESHLFDRSIADNILYGDPTGKATMTDVIGVARLANIHEFVEKLPIGYNTLVGDLGSQLSGGERQRIAICRALIRDPKILILDEATSSLDSHNEKIVQAALDRASQGRTTIVVAHRLSTIRHADCIAILNNGSVAERGTHDQLMSRRGIYWRLMKDQEIVKQT